MNFLAHAYLSFGRRQILVGNVIADFVKGSQQQAYDWDVRQGIRLHRAIDDFTDQHPATAKAKTFFRPHYRLYAAPLVDIVYDHFLAADGLRFTEDSLQQFAQSVYATMEQAPALPPAFAQMLPYMKRDNWLYDYRSLNGIEKSLQRLVRRATYLTDSRTAFALLQQHYTGLRDCYHQLMPDAEAFARQWLAAQEGPV